MQLDPLAQELLHAAYARQFTTGEPTDWRKWAAAAGHDEADARRAFMELNDRYLIASTCGCLRLRPAGIQWVEEEERRAPPALPLSHHDGISAR
jgi:hypothetical protein